MTDSKVQEASPSLSVPFAFQAETPHPSVNSPLKRILDIVGALIGLAIVAILFVPLAVMIRLDSEGPILYKQQRYGLRGRPFTILKFRSMVKDADRLKSSVPNQAQGLIFKNDKDPRITRVGKFLRRTSLDELPQFWNVLKGEMSLVGTRPPTHDEVVYYDDRHWSRLRVKPGMTGVWQTSGRSHIKDFEAILELDLLYQDRWTPLYDLLVIWKTIVALFTKIDAF
jgi:lipopolysaccharide/colanic/teichoic acid biosynthesis glycosyltransferase